MQQDTNQHKKIGSLPIYQPTCISQYKYIEKETKETVSFTIALKIIWNKCNFGGKILAQ